MVFLYYSQVVVFLRNLCICSLKKWYFCIGVVTVRWKRWCFTCGWDLSPVWWNLNKRRREKDWLVCNLKENTLMGLYMEFSAAVNMPDLLKSMAYENKAWKSNVLCVSLWEKFTRFTHFFWDWSKFPDFSLNVSQVEHR